jgi:hypothetical protein
MHKENEEQLLQVLLLDNKGNLFRPQSQRGVNPSQLLTSDVKYINTEVMERDTNCFVCVPPFPVFIGVLSWQWHDTICFTHSHRKHDRDQLFPK